MAAAVPEVVAPPPGNPRFPLFDSLRAIAALSIVLVHTALFSGVFGHASYQRLVAHLDIGVTIFFVISGFLLYRPMLAARILEAPRTPIPTYARRRFLRIVPAFWLALTVLAIFPGIYGVFTGHFWVYYGLLQNFPVYTPAGKCAPLTVTSFNCGITPVWSLTIEVIFYALLPFFALAMARLTSRLRETHWLPVELGVLAALAGVSIWIQGFHVHSSVQPYLFYSPLGRAWWFGLGMTLAALSVWVEQRGEAPPPLRWVARHPEVPWLAAAVIYLVAALVLFKPVPTLSGPAVPIGEYVAEYLVFGLVAALVVVPAVFNERRRGLPQVVLEHPVLSWLGLVSYGIFLWHFPIMYALVQGHIQDWVPSLVYPVLIATTLAITIVCAALSYYLVERPLMRLKYRRSAARVD
jgi:peptidoglycan/LPS O-acetylase OafA/YrhL